jgi:hypothetical protein
VQAPYLALTRPPVCWATRQTSVLIDEFIALKLDSLDDVIQVLFSRKITGYIWNVVNPDDYKIFYGLTQRCNEGWKNRRPDAGGISQPLFSSYNPRPAATFAAPDPSVESRPPAPSLLITAGARTSPDQGQQGRKWQVFPYHISE